MQRKILILISIVVLPLVLILVFNWQLVVFLVLGVLSGPPHMGSEVAETLSVSNESFDIRIDMHLEKGGFFPGLNGAYYTYSSSLAETDYRQKVMTVRHDDPNPIDPNSAQFVSNEIGFVFGGATFAITQDAGKTWKLWNAWDHKLTLEYEKHKLYGSIEDVNLDVNGQGTMRLYSVANKPIEQPLLRTTDYGVTWDIK